MRSKKFWLILKGVLIILLTIVIFMVPTPDSFRKWLRFGMLVVFVASFIMDIIRYKEKNG